MRSRRFTRRGVRRRNHEKRIPRLSETRASCAPAAYCSAGTASSPSASRASRPERSVGVLRERRAHHSDDADKEIQREVLVGAHLLVMLDDVGRRLDASHTDHREHKAPRVGTERALDSQQFAMRSSPYRREHEKIRINAVYQQPIWFNMAFPVATICSR